jgi:hypothetical protein
MQGRQQKKERNMITTNDIGQERQHLTAVLRNGGCSASYDSFVVGSSSVLRMNICAKNPPLRKAENRWR